MVGENAMPNDIVEIKNFDLSRVINEKNIKIYNKYVGECNEKM